MTGLTLIVDGELTTICRPLGRRAIQNAPLRDAHLAGEEDLFVALSESAAWVAEDTTSTWARPDLMRVFSAGIPPVARTILEEIARRPEGYPFDDLHRTLGMTRLRIAASLDVAADAARAFPDKPALVRRDDQTRTYGMPPEVAAFLDPVPHTQNGRADEPAGVSRVAASPRRWRHAWTRTPRSSVGLRVLGATRRGADHPHPGRPLAKRMLIDDGGSGAMLRRPALKRLRDLAASGGLDWLAGDGPDRPVARHRAKTALLTPHAPDLRKVNRFLTRP